MSTVKEIFDYLFEIAKESKDPEGVVAACVVRNGEIIIGKPSSDDSQYHAEFLVLTELKSKGLFIQPSDILYTTLEPCSNLPAINDGRDCTTCLIDASIKHIVYAAKDPEYSTKAAERLKKEEVTYQQVENKEIIKRAEDLFNSTIKVKFSDMKLPRMEKI